MLHRPKPHVLRRCRCPVVTTVAPRTMKVAVDRLMAVHQTTVVSARVVQGPVTENYCVRTALHVVVLCFLLHTTQLHDRALP